MSKEKHSKDRWWMPDSAKRTTDHLLSNMIIIVSSYRGFTAVLGGMYRGCGKDHKLVPRLGYRGCGMLRYSGTAISGGILD